MICSAVVWLKLFRKPKNGINQDQRVVTKMPELCVRLTLRAETLFCTLSPPAGTTKGLAPSVLRAELAFSPTDSPAASGDPTGYHQAAVQLEAENEVPRQGINSAAAEVARLRDTI